MMRLVSIGSAARMAGLAALCTVMIAAAVRADTVGDRAAVTGALEASAAGWSGDDLDRFMAVYEDGPATTYLKGPAVVRGFAAIRAMYAARFAGVPGGMGRLTLDVVEYRPLGPDYALCIGHFRLTRSAAAPPPASGTFSLVFHRTPAGWKIVSDHTSS